MGDDPYDSSPSLVALASASLGHGEMDNQHQRIFQVLVRLDESLRGPFPLETLGARLKQHPCS
jgi:hypothetical protein